MKKLFAVLALVAVMTSCKDKKKEEKKPEETTTTTPETTTTSTETATPTNSASSGVPTFSDPEIQKFANEYAAFVQTYKTGITDPAKAQALAKSAMDWSSKTQAITAKLMQNPKEAQALATFLAACSKEMMPSMK